MDFSHFLACYHLDRTVSAREVYAGMLEQARHAEALGYCALTIPEHHFINILMNPAPLVLATRVASVTERIPIVTAVLVLPFADVKRLAGEVAVTDILTDGRLEIGVGRGAFAYEFSRFGVTLPESRERFDESLEVLEALLTREEVSWDGRYYRFPPLTVMPRPLQRPAPPIWMAALAPQAIYHSARRGYRIMTTALSAAFATVREQVSAFREGVAAGASAVRPQRLSLLRVGFVARDRADAEAKIDLAYRYYRHFYGVRSQDAVVERGAIRPIELEQTREAIGEALLIGTAGEVADKIAPYAELGIDELDINMNFGAAQKEVLESMSRFAEEVMPRFGEGAARAAAAPR